VNTQQRFKRTDVPIRSFQISISQSPLGDFCNTIHAEADISKTCPQFAYGPQPDAIVCALVIVFSQEIEIPPNISRGADQITGPD
jgi:hypothetical protein